MENKIIFKNKRIPNAIVFFFDFMPARNNEHSHRNIPPQMALFTLKMCTECNPPSPDRWSLREEHKSELCGRPGGQGAVGWANGPRGCPGRNGGRDPARLQTDVMGQRGFNWFDGEGENNMDYSNNYIF